MPKPRKSSETDLPTVPDTTNDPAEQQEPSETSPERIAARAYEIYLARGGGHGQDWEDWLIAERELANGRPPRDE
jgi:hypothetical protein